MAAFLLLSRDMVGSFAALALLALVARAGFIFAVLGASTSSISTLGFRLGIEFQIRATALFRSVNFFTGVAPGRVF